ncbi:Glu-tRNA(Gln) amidotransferase GatDE subunit E [Ancylomarina euxinus]|uniref:Glu-tRNA(Gln) amidotransferase GatDE subunit E n=1 Tax=Ancylomarina euxinus TaxID=2283627 RepID=A0A425Y2Q6_9BACT|nr:Glu-tRNA(Gln) amidotransferase subunit GatE [Ancylomarina euxinus]MCZ4694941.1 Glu-tRNA(Gln) amidotransferase subunit GatE [Ancylomarina euxinus]MUP14807.1 Glu-tRNA(Gln) amidotransferase subunit GatE [Ancylomarina euxinus]RRG22151.1 Glu-tRNA(Gln) amidotransferase GatDE subunit E [Ancylomarina euxinus]
MPKFNPVKNYQNTRKTIGYVTRKEATEKDYKRIGFMSGLEVHQQLKTEKKLFCHCPAGVLHNHNDFDAEIIRHMRPTLSELGEYDGTALMEFKTRKEITYRLNNNSACTYEIDDTPPFIINKEALEYALEISLLSNLNIVGEVHITRKQYLDGSIPAGFQRTAILGVEGHIQLKNKKVRLIQLSIEEDSCREISDIGHNRVYKTDRLGMPLIETVTYPECYTPDELREAAEYIRFLNRSTGKVRTGMGAGREDVNVSCKGGTRIEIKGVAHNKWIPELSHNEAFRQWALLHVQKRLKDQVKNPEAWKIKSQKIDPTQLKLENKLMTTIDFSEKEVYAVNLEGFQGILSHFTQPGQCFANEITDRLKVVACIEKPNMIHSEEIDGSSIEADFNQIKELLKADDKDAQMIFWGPKDDIPTALETIEERCTMAFDTIPEETRKSFKDGTTIFERVLPGADRMYPDTDSAPIPLPNDYIEGLNKNLPIDISKRYEQLRNWGIPTDADHYILRNNLVPVIEKIEKLKIPAKFVGTFFAHNLKYAEGKYKKHDEFKYNRIVKMFEYIQENKLHYAISKLMLPVLLEHPNMDFSSILTSINFKKRNIEELLAPVNYLIEKFRETNGQTDKKKTVDWIMGQLHKQATGNLALSELKTKIEKAIK